MNNYKPIYCIYFFFLFFTRLYAGDTAYEIYSSAEQADTIFLREKQFNESLVLYHELLKKAPTNGKIHFNLANNYFQLGQYGDAIYHYLEAMPRLPSESKVEYNLSIALEKAQVSPRVPFYIKLQHSRFYQFFVNPFFLVLISGIVFILLSLAIWYGFRRIKPWFILSLSLLVLVTSLWVQKVVFPPLYGVIIQPTQLRIDAGQHYQPVDKGLMVAGTIVSITPTSSSDLGWFYVRNKDVQGYVSSQSVRILSQ